MPRRGRARTVSDDVDCRVSWAVGCVLARMDVHHRLRWFRNSELGALPGAVDRQPLDWTDAGPRFGDPSTLDRAGAFAEIFGVLPLGRLWAWPMRLPGVRTLPDRAYDLFARNRTTISGSSAWPPAE